MAVKIGWVAELRRFPPSTQKKSLEAAGVAASKTYISPGETLAEMLNDAARPDAVLHVHRLAALASSRVAWRSFVELLDGRALSIVETATGRKMQLPADAAEMIAGLTDDWAGNRVTAAQAKNAGKKGARKRWGFKERTPIRTAAAIWKNWAEFHTPADALSHKDMAGWTESTARKYLGKRGAPPGPISAREE